jgi:transcriptional regulator with XRE-family HTH domain
MVRHTSCSIRTFSGLREAAKRNLAHAFYEPFGSYPERKDGCTIEAGSRNQESRDTHTQERDVISANYHHGQTIKEYRTKRGLSQAALAEYWPGGPKNVRYVQYIESGRKQIVDQRTLRELGELLDIPLWRFGLSEYNPFNPQHLPGRGEHMFQETLDTVEQLIQKAWYMRRVAPAPVTEQTARYLRSLFAHFLTFLPPPSVLEPRFLRLYAQVERLNAIMLIEQKHYKEALATFAKMFAIAKELGEPATLALALMGLGTELERAGYQQEAINRLEEARDASFGASRQIAALVMAYLARAYASTGDALRFQRTIDTAQSIAANLKEKYGDGTDYVFHRLSGILAERSYGYLEIKEPRKTLDMRADITLQIDLTHNTWLHAWIPLDWARAYFMLNEIEESVNEGLEFFHRASSLQSPHAISRAYGHLITLEDAGYADMQAVQHFREQLEQAQREQAEGQERGNEAGPNTKDTAKTFFPSAKTTPPHRQHNVFPKREMDTLAKDTLALMTANKTEPRGITFMKATTDDIQEEYDLATSMFGDAVHNIPTRHAWLRKNPDTDFIVRDRGRLVGFINILPVKHETIMRFMRGEIRGWDIPAEDVLPFTPGSLLECIVMGMATTPEAKKTIRAQYGAKLIRGLIDFLHHLTTQNIIITKLYATSVTPTGIAILRNAGFHEIGQVDKRIAFELDTITADAPLATAYRRSLNKGTDLSRTNPNR